VSDKAKSSCIAIDDCYASTLIETRLGDDGVGYTWTEFSDYFSDVNAAAFYYEAAQVVGKTMAQAQVVELSLSPLHSLFHNHFSPVCTLATASSHFVRPLVFDSSPCIACILTRYFLRLIPW
jgi:hypothetical protein